MQLEISPPKRSDRLAAGIRIVSSIAAIGFCIVLLTQVKGMGSGLRALVTPTKKQSSEGTDRRSLWSKKSTVQSSVSKIDDGAIGRIGPSSKQARLEGGKETRSKFSTELKGVQQSWDRATPNLSRAVVSGLRKGERFAKGTEQAIRELPETITEATGIEEWGRQAAWKMKRMKQSSASSTKSSGSNGSGSFRR